MHENEILSMFSAVALKCKRAHYSLIMGINISTPEN